MDWPVVAVGGVWPLTGWLLDKGGLLFFESFIRIFNEARSDGVGGWFDSIDWGVVETADWGVGGAVVEHVPVVCAETGVGVEGVNGGGGERTLVEPGVVGAEAGAGDRIGNCFVDTLDSGDGARCNGGGVIGVDGTTWAMMFDDEPLLPLLRLSRRLTAFSMIEVQSNAESGTCVWNT